MKKYIDYLFWKRTWFRMFFVIIPIWMVPVVYFLYKLHWMPNDAKVGGEDTRLLLSVMYLLLFFIGILDNDGIDSPPNPFKAKVPKRFRSWSEASKYLDKEIVVELEEIPNVIGRMTSIEVVGRTAYLTVEGSSMQFLHWRCRPKV